MPRYHTTANGPVQYTPEEEAERDAEEAAWAAAAASRAKVAIQAQIDLLERASMMNRGVRELQLRLMEKEAAELAAAQSTPENPITATQILATVSAYVKFKALDDQIAILRGQLGAYP